MTTQHQANLHGTIATVKRTAAAVGMTLAAALLSPAHADAAGPDISHLAIHDDMQLRRMVTHNDHPKGTVLLLHGFPETLHAWDDIAQTLGAEYEVHAFDWPGYGESSRPTPDRFAYAPVDYAKVLKVYIDRAGIDKSNLVIYATDIGALPALIAAMDDPGIAKSIIVGDFAPFDRPQFMQERLQALKDPKSAKAVRDAFNTTRDEILENAFTRGLAPALRYELSATYRADLAHGWQNGALTSADAFYHYYSHFTRDQDALEARLDKLKTPIKVIWGEQDLYIHKEMGIEFARRIGAPIELLAQTGHYPHLQHPHHTVREIRAALP